MTEADAEAVKRQRAASFGAVAGDYERSRPGYPDEAVRWMAGADSAMVLDVAAGTGKLTTQLRDLGNSVIALELSEQMLRQLRSLARAIPVAAGRAETLPFRAASFDVITVAQAWHWFDQPAAAAEFARVLRPGGHACILWNFRDESVDWVAELSTIIGSEGTSETESEGDPLGGRSGFTPSTERTYRFDQPLDQDLLVSLVRSRSYVASLPADEQRAVLSRILELCQEHPQLSGRPEFSMPYRTLVFRAERL
jgi:SAM-dependent methyltransferase